jgi:hypothetical protein
MGMASIFFVVVVVRHPFSIISAEISMVLQTFWIFFKNKKKFFFLPLELLFDQKVLQKLDFGELYTQNENL